MTPWILSSNGRPFTDEQAAQVKRELLRAELGGSIALEVRPHPDGGYAICCPTLPNTGERPLAASPGPNISSRANGSVSALPVPASTRATTLGSVISDGTPTEPLAYPDEFRVSPAGRTFGGYYLLILLGMALLFEPHALFVALDLRFPLAPKFATAALGLVMIAGALVVLISLGRLVWACARQTYVVDRVGVHQVEWHLSRFGLLRSVPRIRFQDLRAVDVHQTLGQLLMSLGTLRLTAGGCSVGEVILQQVSSPRRLQAELQRRMRQALSGAAEQLARTHARR